jgi:Zn-dependent M28 family amino/carboxypeptidase
MDDVTLSLDAGFVVSEIQSANVVAMVEGTDPKIRDKYVTVGAHLDHVGHEGGVVFNGADDDASGCVAVLEAAEAVAMDPPGHSAIFILYTGEELRFMGSQHFVLNPPVPLESIHVNINLDMVGRPDGAAKELAAIVGGEKASVIQEMISDVNKRKTRLRLDSAYDKYFMMSDQVSFYLSGIPAVFLHDGDHADLHRPTDDADKIDYDFLKKTSQLTYFLVKELGSLL